MRTRRTAVLPYCHSAVRRTAVLTYCPMPYCRTAVLHYAVLPYCRTALCRTAVRRTGVWRTSPAQKSEGLSCLSERAVAQLHSAAGICAPATIVRPANTPVAVGSSAGNACCFHSVFVSLWTPPSQGGGVRTKLAPGTLESSLEFETLP